MIIVTRHQAGRKVNKDDAQHRGRRPKARRGTRICFLNVCVFSFSIKFSTIYSGLLESLGECTTGVPSVAPRCPHARRSHLPSQAPRAARTGPEARWQLSPPAVLMAGPCVYKRCTFDPPGPPATSPAEAGTRRGCSDACLTRVWERSQEVTWSLSWWYPGSQWETRDLRNARGF